VVVRFVEELWHVSIFGHSAGVTFSQFLQNAPSNLQVRGLSFLNVAGVLSEILLSVACGSKAGLFNQPRLRPQHIADLFEPGAQGVVEKVGVALCSLDLRIAEALPDHR